MSARGWTTVGDIVARLRRRWDDGSLLTGHAKAEPFEPVEVPLRGPASAAIGDDIAAVRDWVAALDAGRRDDTCYELEWKSVGGRKIGRNELPARAVLRRRGQVWALLGVTGTVRRFDGLLEVSRRQPRVQEWITEHPHRALALASQIPQLIAAYEWLDAHRHSRRYLREISAPGVDTKFVERHRTELAGMLGVAASSSGFISDLGLRHKPALVRLRPSPSLGLPAALTELAVRAGELARLHVQPRVAVIVENEISYLSVDVPDDGIVLWGRGFDVDDVGRLPWLGGAEVVYWGDIDTHGFAILDRLRAWLPETRSVLMDRETLLAHHDRWVSEDRPARSALTRLTVDEFGLYTDLVEAALGDRVRLEQERIDWNWVERHLSLAT
ncbi:Wadjet anti-phage system protein JetD domain-containing protein [Mycolicibacterium sp.]|uniref:Wadjet anti-phage system protein JetD domain-containing protein n=1 Tax=Mycolicibacterium sp. TaxID=2320850 RepID=UPI003D115548